MGHGTRRILCVDCHMPPTAKSALEGDIKSHTFEPIWPGFVMQEPDFSWTDFLLVDGFQVGPMPDSCTSCHAHDPASGRDNIVTQWASSSHADGYDEPFNHWNAEGEVQSGCARCHSAGGFQQLANSSDSTTGIPDYTTNANGISPDYTAVTAQSAIYPKVLNCETCHVPNGGGETRWEAGQVQQVAFPSGVLKSLGNNSNICMQCHQGRESGKSVEYAEMGQNGYYRFINRHYFAEAAIYFGSEVTAGYEYPGKSYVGRNTFPDHAQINKQDCIQCHMARIGGSESDHDFFPALLSTDDEVGCNSCHKNISSFDDLGLPNFQPNVDYDGDGIGESFRHEIDGMQAELIIAMNVYAEANSLAPIMYTGGYPYFFTASCYQSNAGCVPEASGAYATFDKPLLQAAFNYHSAQDPGSGIHNYRYVIQTVYDSIEDMDPTAVNGLTRP
jgi:hypothetical protein